VRISGGIEQHYNMQCGAGLTASSIADWHFAYIIPQQNRTDFTINILPDLQAAPFEPHTTLQLSMSIYVLQKISVTSLPCIILCKAVHTKNFTSLLSAFFFSLSAMA